MNAERRRSQKEKFKEAARELGCDDDPEHFAETVRKIASAPPVHKPSKRKASKPKTKEK